MSRQPKLSKLGEVVEKWIYIISFAIILQYVDKTYRSEKGQALPWTDILKKSPEGD